ncbi:Clp protease N-terminal domain-containing protein [Candidatus Zixiibacteriota bacterium]
MAFLSPRAKQILEQAARKAREMQAENASSEHLLWTLLADENGIAALVLRLCKVDRQKLIAELEKLLSQEYNHSGEGP